MAQLALAIVERDAAFGELLTRFFAQQGFRPELFRDAAGLLPRLANRAPEMIVLGDGGEAVGALATLRCIRDLSRVPCIVIAGGANEVSQILLLEAGADDLIDRGLPPRAILARVRAVLRRAAWGVADPPAGPIELGSWRLVVARRQLLRPDGSECPLTTAEFDLMRLLVESGGKPVSRDAIAEGVFRRPFRAEDRTVDNLVLRLRRKLGEAQEEAIKTVRGAGYMFAGFNEETLPDRRVA